MEKFIINKEDACDEALGVLTCHLMLHIFITMKYRKGFVPLHERNSIAIKYLKDKQGLPQFKPCKKEIKTMLHIARKGGDLLARLDLALDK
jgi:hypothetical protein